VTVLETKAITTYGSIRKAAEALNSDIKAILYNEKTQKPALFFYLPPFSPPLMKCIRGGKEGGGKN
jgi:molybdenum-dependent DNA-binding transcriptional regulator ModE